MDSITLYSLIVIFFLMCTGLIFYWYHKSSHGSKDKFNLDPWEEMKKFAELHQEGKISKEELERIRMTLVGQSENLPGSMDNSSFKIDDKIK